jgi:hypothetical protein
MSTLGTIIIVPGIGGCELSSQPTLFGLGPPVRLWLNPSAMAGGGWRLLGLADDGITPDVPLTGPIVPGLPLGNYYADLGKMLSEKGWRVVGARLDWRQALARDADRLVSLIREEEPAGPLHLVAHSRGGLVARRAIEQLRAAGELGRLGWCAGLGVPHYGSWEAAGLLAGWNRTAALLAVVLEGTASILSAGYVQLRLRHVLTSWPAAYELLPNPAAPAISPNEIEEIYGPGTWSAAGLSVSAAWLQAARKGWASIPLVPPGVDWIDVVGIGSRTPTRLYTPAQVGTSQGWRWDFQGDSVVPSRWAVQPNRPRITTPSSHGALAYDGRVVDVLSTALQVGLAEDVVIEGELLQ